MFSAVVARKREGDPVWCATLNLSSVRE